MRVSLRDVEPTDFPIHYDQQRDPESVRMTVVPARDRETFEAHLRSLIADPETVVLTVVADGEVAGSALSFVREGRRQVGYRLGREHWGRGVATAALELLLRDHVTERPVYAQVAEHNPASRRVLEKCGFELVGGDAGGGVPFSVLRLD